MRNNQVTKFLILFVFVFLCSCDLFKSMCEAEKPPKQSTTLQQIVNDTNAGETIDLEKYSNEYDITDYNAEISKNLTIKNGSFQNTTLKIKAEVKLEKVQELSVETSANLTIRDSKLNNLLLGTNAESRSTNSGNTNFDLKVIVKNCEIAEKIKINSKAKLNIAGEKTKIAKIVVAVAAEVCKILCTTEVDTKKIENVITDENGEKPEEIKITQAYKITYHSNCDELEDIEDFFSPDDGTISLPTDIFKRNDYIFAGWYEDNNQAVEDSINVSDKTADIHVYAKWESAAVNKIAGIYKLLNESATIEIKNDGTFVVTVTISGDIDGYMNGNWKKANEENYEFIFDDNTAGTATSIEEDVIKMVYKNENEGMDIDSYAVKISNENVDLSGTWIDENSIIIIKEDTFTATLKDGSSKNGNIEKIGNFFKLETFAWGAISASKQALYIDPYGKEITPSVYTKSTTNEESFEDLGGTGVYSYTVNITDIAINWGTTESPRFSVVLLNETTLATCSAASDFKQATAAEPEYIIEAFGNMRIRNTAVTGNHAVYGANVIDGEYQYYNGVAVTVTAEDVTLYVDMAKLVKTDLKALFKDTGNGDEAVMTGDDLVDLTGYKPYVIALGTEIADPDNYCFSAWSADVMKMAEGATFPTNLQQSAPTTGNENEVTEYTVTASEVATTISKLSHGEHILKVTGEITSDTITEIATAMTNNTTPQINLDLSGTTGLTEIADSAFSNCFRLTSITIPNSVTTIGSNAFYNCSGLTSIEIPNSVTTIKSGAFEACSGLTSLTIPDSVTTIGGQAFLDCSSLKSIEIPNSVTTIGYYAFFNCSSLTSVTIGNGVTTIGSNAFEGCLSLTSVTIPSKVDNIGYRAFAKCSNLTKFEIDSGNQNYLSLDDGKILCRKIEDGTIFLIDYPSATGDITIPDSVTSIGQEAFFRCSGLTNITIGNNVTTIGDFAFYNCSSLTNVTIPGNVTTIGGYVFNNCSNLTNVTINNGVTTIGQQAFHNCSSLKSITIPDSVESIESFSFVGCNNLTTFEVGTNNSNFSSSNDKHILFNKDKTELIAYPSATGDITTILDSDSVTTIKSGAFEACSGLTSLTIPDSVTTIEYRAIPDCINLKTVIIGSGVKNIYNNVFEGCSNLEDVTFRDTNNWYYTSNSNFTSGEEIVVTDTAQNATKLKENDKYWYKESSTGGTAN